LKKATLLGRFFLGVFLGSFFF